MLGRYANSDRISAVADHDDQSALLVRYDAVLPQGQESKWGIGIAHSKDRNAGEGWSANGFHIHRTDGTSVDFSYIRAV